MIDWVKEVKNKKYWKSLIWCLLSWFLPTPPAIFAFAMSCRQPPCTRTMSTMPQPGHPAPPHLRRLLSNTLATIWLAWLIVAAWLAASQVRKINSQDLVSIVSEGFLCKGSDEKKQFRHKWTLHPLLYSQYIGETFHDWSQSFSELADTNPFMYQKILIIVYTLSQSAGATVSILFLYQPSLSWTITNSNETLYKESFQYPMLQFVNETFTTLFYTKCDCVILLSDDTKT